MSNRDDNYINILGFNIYAKGLKDFVFTDKCVVNTLNAYSYSLSKKDKGFKEALQKSDLLLPDGFPIAIAARFLHKRKIQKIAGMDLFKHTCEILNRNGGKCFFLGSTSETLNQISTRLKVDFPNIIAEFYSPPFKTYFSDDENKLMVQHINQFEPNVIFVGMTAPKQEKWVLENQGKIEKGIICSIGAVFDFYAGTVKRPNKFWIDLKLEWLIRLAKEPRRMWKRYLVYSPVFFIDLLSACSKRIL